MRELLELMHFAFGYGTILDEFGGELLDRDTDCIARIANFTRTFYVDVPTREDWSNGCVSQFYRNIQGQGWDLFAMVIEGLPTDCIILHAEIYEVDTATEMIKELELDRNLREVSCCTACSGVIYSDGCVMGYIESLRKIGWHSVRLGLGHKCVKENELAKERDGSGLWLHMCVLFYWSFSVWWMSLRAGGLRRRVYPCPDAKYLVPHNHCFFAEGKRSFLTFSK